MVGQIFLNAWRRQYSKIASGGTLMRALAGEVAEDLKKKAEVGPEAELEAKLRLESKRKGKPSVIP